jgi:hypothetical protein
MKRALRHWRLAACCGLGLSAAACARTDCELPKERAQALDLRRDADRAHLAIDLAAIDKVADRYGDWAGAHPPSDASHVTVDNLRRHARAYCQSLLTKQIATVHGVSVDAINERRALGGTQTVSRR